MAATSSSAAPWHCTGILKNIKGNTMTEATDKLLKDFDKALADYPLLMTKNQTAGVLNVSVASINRLLAVG
jgi:hypothetical protein